VCASFYIALNASQEKLPDFSKASEGGQAVMPTNTRKEDSLEGKVFLWT
jgi:hypothetical protein